MSIGRNICIKELFLKKYIKPFPGKTIVEDAQRKFTALNARSWRVVKAKVHDLIFNERKKK